MIVIGENNLNSHGSVIATIGSFDGVHRGHQFLFSQLRDKARELRLTPAVVIFRNHPQITLNPESEPLPLLTTHDEKLSLLERFGIELAIVLDFTPQLAQLSAAEFMDLLKEKFGVQALMMGFNHRFGHNAPAGLEPYRIAAQTLGMQIFRAEEFHSESVSSSRIRKLITDGQIAEANGLLGYEFTIQGTVTQGLHNGSRIGFPTANISPLPHGKILPPRGAYAVVATIDGVQYQGMAGLGSKPSVTQQGDISLETNLFNYNGEELYGKQMAVRFIQRLRGEISFPSIPDLAVQLAKDKLQATKILNKYNLNENGNY